jgi:hypothetical protein
MRPDDAGPAMSEYRPEVYVWVLQNVRRVAPVSIKGRLMLFNVEDSIIEVLDPAVGIHRVEKVA